MKGVDNESVTQKRQTPWSQSIGNEGSIGLFRSRHKGGIGAFRRIDFVLSRLTEASRQAEEKGKRLYLKEIPFSNREKHVIPPGIKMRIIALMKIIVRRDLAGQTKHPHPFEKARYKFYNGVVG